MNEQSKQKIKMRIGSHQWEISITGPSIKTGFQILNILPVESECHTWGEEIYFTIPLNMPKENAQSIVSLADVAYWPDGQGFCVFFGKTPITKELNEIRPASPVNVFGKIHGDLEKLKQIKPGAKVLLEPV